MVSMVLRAVQVLTVRTALMVGMVRPASAAK